jgi:NADH-quinone oxidoreductase subunit M
MLSIIIFLPLLGAVALALIVRRRESAFLRWGSFAVSLATFGLSLVLLARYNPPGTAFQFEEHYPWIPAWGISYHLGIDGLSLLLVLLTNLLTTISILSSFTAIRQRQKEYYIFMLILQTGILGTFLALDLFLFYIFWEVMLIPLYFLIGIWGSADRIYATMKFILFTMTGSVLMLVGILTLYFKSAATFGHGTFDLVELYELGLGAHEQFWLFLALFFAFAIKVPMFPLHTWLPDAHTEAPTAGSVILAGVLLKTGVYGILRFCIPLFPLASRELAPVISWLAIVAIIYGALTAFAQKDAKRLVAYSSVSHMGCIILGIFAFNLQAVSGGIIQMINHGISTGGLFLCVGMIYERRHTRLMADFGGLAQNLHKYAVLTMIIMLSSVGLPGLNGFIGEFLIILGVFKHNVAYAVIAATGVILAAVYLLTMYQKIFFGPNENPENQKLTDLRAHELWSLIPLVLLAFWIGLYPKPFLNIIEPASNAIVQAMRTSPVPEIPPQFMVKASDEIPLQSSVMHHSALILENSPQPE